MKHVTRKNNGSLIVIALLFAAIQMSPASAAVPAPLHQLPFTCGETWTASFRTSHSASTGNDLDAIDFNKTNDHGAPVFASAPGVATVLSGGGFGNHVVIDHGNGYESLYAHLEDVTVTTGASVRFGTQIGTVGDTGTSVNPGAYHLHYEQKTSGAVVKAYFDGIAVPYVGNSPSGNVTSNNCKRWNSSGHFAEGFIDFNGDKKTDVLRPSSSGWQVSYSGTSSWTQINGSQYGLDALAFGDFNGDAKTDVFRPNANGWQVSYSGTSSWTQISGSQYKLHALGLGSYTG
ncbi:MAG: peptidoglycan DD-metalloendopeptidase family protein [Actinomycetota bacterium]